jgi:hypothetical protein
VAQPRAGWERSRRSHSGGSAPAAPGALGSEKGALAVTASAWRHGFERQTERTQQPHQREELNGVAATTQRFWERRRLPDSSDTVTDGFLNREGSGVSSRQWKMVALQRSLEEVGGGSGQERCQSGGGFYTMRVRQQPAPPRSANGSMVLGDTVVDWWATRVSIF